MKTNFLNRVSRGLGQISAMVGAAILSASGIAGADVVESTAGQFRGIYKVVASNDPIFPATATREYFLDFGKGMQAGKLSGSVSISMRQNPNVKVRIMAWQYFPKQGSLVIGNPYSEGSRNAVAKGIWILKGTSNGVVFERENYQVVLRANPDDY
ncbi:MAG: hypothetical protein V4689_15575 [Verrucomicrobiota bacterium]